MVVAIPWRCNLAGPSRDAGVVPDREAALVAAARPRAAPPAAPPPLGSPSPPAEPPERAAWVPSDAKQEAPRARIEREPARPRPAHAATLPDEVVFAAMNRGQPAFLRCWARAQRIEGLDATKVRLHLEIDGAGRVTAARSDTGSPTLSRCLIAVARQLPFPAPDQPAVVELPLMFR